MTNQRNRNRILRMPTRCSRGAMASALAALFMIFADVPTAYALTSGNIEWMKFPKVEVANNGSSYTGVTGIGYGWEAEFKIDSGIIGKIKSWKVWPVIQANGLSAYSLDLYAASKSYSVGNRPKHVHKTVGEIFPDVAIKNYALQVCNLHRTLLNNQGHPDSYVFGNEHKIAITVSGGLSFDVTQGDTIIEAFQTHSEIVCKKWQGAAIPQAGNLKMKTVMQVTKAKLSISPAYNNLTADCPVTVPLVAEFEATMPGTLQFRFVSAQGKISSTYHATVTGQTNGIYKTKYEKQISVPLPQTPAGNSGGQGGAINQAAGGGLAAATPTVDPLFPSGQSSGGMAQYQNKMPAGNVHSESFRVEVLSPSPGVVSGYHGYHITCKPKLNDGIGISPKPTFGINPNGPTAPGNATVPMKAAPTSPAISVTPARRK